MACYGQWGPLPAGRIPVRLYRVYKWKGDKLGKYRLEAEYVSARSSRSISAMAADLSLSGIG